MYSHILMTVLYVQLFHMLISHMHSRSPHNVTLSLVNTYTTEYGRLHTSVPLPGFLLGGGGGGGGH